MDDANFHTMCWWGIVFFVALLCFSLLGTVANDDIEMKREAIKRGYAEYKVDEDGHTTFTWKEQK